MAAMEHAPVTRMAEDYLTLIWKAYEWPGGQPTTTDMAAQLGVTPSTVSANLKKLAHDGLVDHQPYATVELTAAGRKIAVDTVRRHRIIETYLVKRLGLGWDQVHHEADRLEHAVSDLVLDRMNADLGSPAADPHGDPIPAEDGQVALGNTIALSDLAPGTTAVVARVSDRSSDLLRHLQHRGLTVGARVRVDHISTAAAAIGIAVGNELGELSLTAAQAVRVRAGA